MPGICSRCSRNVYFAEEKLALGRVWHGFCFSCRICGKLLNSWSITTYQDDLYCQKCCPKPKSTCYSLSPIEGDKLSKAVNKANCIIKDAVEPETSGSRSPDDENILGEVDNNGENASCHSTISFQDEYSVPYQKTSYEVPSREIPKQSNSLETMVINSSTDMTSSRASSGPSESSEKIDIPHNGLQERIDEDFQSKEQRLRGGSGCHCNYDRADQFNGCHDNYPRAVRSCKHADYCKICEWHERSIGCGGSAQGCGNGGNCGGGCRGGCGKPGQNACLPKNTCTTSSKFCRKSRPPSNTSPTDIFQSSSRCCLPKNRPQNPSVSSPYYKSCTADCKDPPVGCECLGGGVDCQRCGLKVYQAEMQIASGVPYHNICFSCYCCRKPLETLTYHENCGEIYCKQCYVRNFGPQGYGYSGVLQTPM